MRKKYASGKKRLLVLIVTIAILSGCGSRKIEPVEEAVPLEQNQENPDLTLEPDMNLDSDVNTESGNSQTSDLDLDLTVMDSNMVYATIYQMMIDPESYMGQRVRMRGIYQASYYEVTNQYYHCVIVADAMACCSQGMEFIWEDGSHVYPDEYPEDGTEIMVTGIFETYEEEGMLYCRLNQAEMSLCE